MIGLVDRERIDAALYDDFESEKAKEVTDQICPFGSSFTSRRNVVSRSLLSENLYALKKMNVHFVP